MVIFKLILEKQFMLTGLKCHGIRTDVGDFVPTKINFPYIQAQELGIS
jgi:hypothetical protein